MRSCSLVIALMVLSLPIYGQKATGEERSDHKDTKNQQNPTPVTGDVNQPATNSQKDGHSDQSSDYLNALISPNNIPNVALALVGIVGIAAALCTLGWLKEQTKLMGRQVVLMEAASRQTLYLTNWSVRKPNNDPGKLRIKADLINLSTFPMTLKASSIEIGGEAIDIRDNTFLPPNIPIEIETVMGTPEQLSAYDQGTLRLGVAAVFSHIDRISNKIVSQPVYGHLECGWRFATFHWQLHMNPIEGETADQEQDGKQAN
jgi:hypothetical protein